jgi:hypothetical protein
VIMSDFEDAAVKAFPNEFLLTLCDLELDALQQADLSDLLARQREGLLTQADRDHMDALLGEYRRGLIQKARAWNEAVQRGLRPAPPAEA